MWLYFLGWPYFSSKLSKGIIWDRLWWSHFQGWTHFPILPMQSNKACSVSIVRQNLVTGQAAGAHGFFKRNDNETRKTFTIMNVAFTSWSCSNACHLQKKKMLNTGYPTCVWRAITGHRKVTSTKINWIAKLDCICFSRQPPWCVPNCDEFYVAEFPL